MWDTKCVRQSNAEAKQAKHRKEKSREKYLTKKIASHYEWDNELELWMRRKWWGSIVCLCVWVWGAHNSAISENILVADDDNVTAVVMRSQRLCTKHNSTVTMSRKVARFTKRQEIMLKANETLWIAIARRKCLNAAHLRQKFNCKSRDHRNGRGKKASTKRKMQTTTTELCPHDMNNKA